MASEPVVHIIDDDEAARHSLEFLLDCAGKKARSYASAIEFLDGVPSMERGCIVTDVRMPEINGVELVGRLRTMGVPDPVIIITGHADVPMAIQAMKQGISDFIEKPFSDDVILDAINAALAKADDLQQRQARHADIRARLDSLSPREREVLEGLAEGHANKVIAFDLDISARTVEVYRANVMAKMHARSLSELVRMVTLIRMAG